MAGGCSGCDEPILVPDAAIQSPDATPSTPDAAQPDAMIPSGALGPCPPSGECDDGLACNGTIECRDGWCFAGADEVVCEDEVACTIDQCEEPSGTCAYTPDNSLCDDLNDCTEDLCAESGCTHTALADGTLCDLGVCITGSCCSGCVDEAGACQSGDSIFACGSGGVSCGSCPCSSDRCDGDGCPPDYLRAVQVVAGEYHSCARMLGGDIYCWGRNIQGQLGLGDRITRRRPVRVGVHTDWTHLATQHSHTCGIRLTRQTILILISLRESSLIIRSLTQVCANCATRGNSGQTTLLLAS